MRGLKNKHLRDAHQARSIVLNSAAVSAPRVGNAQIRDLYIAAHVQQNVLRLDVAVDDVACM